MPVGPCVICGDRNYPLSLGGSTICPSCDCGIDPKVRKLETELTTLRAEVEKWKNVDYKNANRLIKLKTEVAILRSSIAPVLEAIKLKSPNVYSERDWNPHAHAEPITLTVKECRNIDQALSNPKEGSK